MVRRPGRIGEAAESWPASDSSTFQAASSLFGLERSRLFLRVVQAPRLATISLGAVEIGMALEQIETEGRITICLGDAPGQEGVAPINDPPSGITGPSQVASSILGNIGLPRS